MLTDKKLARIEKILGKARLDELDACSGPQLGEGIVNAEGAVKEASDLLERNSKYLELKEALKALSQGLSELKKYQKAITEYSLHLLEEKDDV